MAYARILPHIHEVMAHGECCVCVCNICSRGTRVTTTILIMRTRTKCTSTLIHSILYLRSHDFKRFAGANHCQQFNRNESLIGGDETREIGTMLWAWLEFVMIIMSKVISMNFNSAGFWLCAIPQPIWHDAHLHSAFRINFSFSNINSQQVTRFQLVCMCFALEASLSQLYVW